VFKNRIYLLLILGGSVTRLLHSWSYRMYVHLESVGFQWQMYPKRTTDYGQVLCSPTFSLSYFCTSSITSTPHFATVRRQFFKEGDYTIPMQKNSSVQVANIPSEYGSTKRLRDFFETLFLGEILFCNIAVFLTPLDVLVQERAVAVAKLEGLIAAFDAHPKRARWSCVVARRRSTASLS
jgi:hypothetical protein